MAEYDESLLDELVVEPKDHLETIEPDLMALEVEPHDIDPEAINRIFRAVHSTKGGFGFFAMHHIMELAHAMENVMGSIRDGGLAVSSEIVDVLLSGTDKLRVLLDDVRNSENISIDEEVVQLGIILGETKEDPPRHRESSTGPSGHQSDGPPEFLEAMEILNTAGSERLSDEPSNRLGDLLRLLRDMTSEDGRPLAEEILSDYLAITQAIGLDGFLRAGVAEKLQKLLQFLPDNEASGMREKSSGSAPAEKKPPTSSLRVGVSLLDKLMNLAGELVLSRNRIKRALADKLSSGMAAGAQLDRLRQQLAASRRHLESLSRNGEISNAQATFGAVSQEFDTINKVLRRLLDSTLADLPGLANAAHYLNSVTTELQDGIMETRMQPVGTLFSKFPRVIRDMSHKLGKEMVLSIQGESVELDRSIIEALADPLTHLIRNSADHGIEAPAIREAAGKSLKGTIELIAHHEGGQVHIQIIDDGAGIDPEHIKGKAIELNLLTGQSAAEMTDREALRLIFAPGFSTAEKVSDISGRGVGMDVVRSNVEKIGGTVEIESTRGQGSRITLKLPLTLAIMPALVVRSEGQDFVIPQVDIEELVRIRASDAAQRIESISGRPVMRLREIVIPLVPLNDVLGIKGTYLDTIGTRKSDRRTRVLNRRLANIIPDAPTAESGAQEESSSAQRGIQDTDADEDQRIREGDRRINRRSAFNIIVLRVGPNQYGLVVESLKDSEEIVIKPLPEHLKSCKTYAGATIMGDGRIAMILDSSGIAETAQLRFGGDLEKVTSAQSDSCIRKSMAERQSLLIFRNGTSESFGISLAMIKRIEKIERGSIESVSNKQFLKYESGSLRILSLHDFLPVKAPDDESDDLYVIVPKLVRHPMGIVARAVEDILETDAPLDRTTIAGTGILGSLVESGRLIICVDVYGLIEAAEPDLRRLGTEEPLRGMRVLLAEDTAFFRAVERDFLEDLGCEVEEALDGEEAWSKLANGNFDILVTDIQMPFVDGLELSTRVRASERHRNMPIVALTSLTSEADRRRIMDAGVNAYEAKLDKEHLRKSLENIATRLRE